AREVEAVDSAQQIQPMVDGLRRRRRLLVQLKAQIIAQDGFVELGQLGWSLSGSGRLRPAREMQQVESIGAQGTWGTLQQMFGVQKLIGPSYVSAMLIDQTIGRRAGTHRWLIGDGELHRVTPGRRWMARDVMAEPVPARRGTARPIRLWRSSWPDHG